MGIFATLRHIRRLTGVEEGLRDVQAQVKALEREWSETHDDLARMLGKISKRAKALEKAETAGGLVVPEQQGEPAGEAGRPIGTKMQTILRQIAIRRGG